MKYKITNALFFCLTFFCLFQVSQAQNAENVVDRFIARQGKQNKAEENREARKILKGDINHDRREDVVVLYTLEGFGGGNGYAQYLAVFINRGNKFVYTAQDAVGGKSNRSLDMESIVNGQINFATQEYLPNDASCCPSRKGNTHFTFSNGKLREISKRSAKRKT